MLDTKSGWWKYIDIDKFKELLSDVPDEVKYITTSQVGEICLLDKDLFLIGLIQLASDDIHMFSFDNEDENED